MRNLSGAYFWIFIPYGNMIALEWPEDGSISNS